MTCEAEKIAAEIKSAKDMTYKQILQKEVFIRNCIATCSHLNKTFNIFLIRKKREEDAINDPTTQETRKDKPPKKKRWWWF